MDQTTSMELVLFTPRSPPNTEQDDSIAMATPSERFLGENHPKHVLAKVWGAKYRERSVSWGRIADPSDLAIAPNSTEAYEYCLHKIQAESKHEPKPDPESLNLEDLNKLQRAAIMRDGLPAPAFPAAAGISSPPRPPGEAMSSPPRPRPRRGWYPPGPRRVMPLQRLGRVGVRSQGQSRPRQKSHESHDLETSSLFKTAPEPQASLFKIAPEPQVKASWSDTLREWIGSMKVVWLWMADIGVVLVAILGLFCLLGYYPVE